jgi:release factor glutamine methyltransferase
MAAGKRLLRLRYRLTQRHRYGQLVLEHVNGRPLLVLPQVFNPALFHSGAFLAGLLDARLIPPGAAVLDMGTGSGVGALAAARLARRVVAVDINPHAVRCARINALLQDVDERMDVRQGDLFAPVAGERFDVVLFNPPFFHGAPRDALDHAWRGLDVVERFAAQLPQYVTPTGCGLVVLSSDGDTPAFLDAFRANHLQVAIVARRKLINETLTVYRLSALGSGGDRDADSV